MKIVGLIAAPLMAALALAGPAQAIAQEAAAKLVVDAEEELDEALKRFGYVAGLALACVAPEQKPKLEREVMDVNNSITRLLGIDRAFLFSSSFGYGTSVDMVTEVCADVLKTYEARVAKHRAAVGGSL